MSLLFKECLVNIPRTYNGLPSVTSILDVLEDPAYILKWKEAAEDPSVVEATLNIARQRGTYVHLVAADYYKKGVKNYDESSLQQYKTEHELPELTPKIMKFLNGFNKFTSLYDVVPLSVEEPFASTELGYGGTPDLVGYLEGDLCLIDWKTSSTARLSEDSKLKYFMQLSAYVADWNLRNPNNLIKKMILVPLTDSRASGLGEIEIVDSNILIRNYFLQFLECKEEFNRLWKLHASYPNGKEILSSQEI